MDKARKILSLASPVFPLKPMISATRQQTIFPVYHLVSDERPEHIIHLYKIRTAKEFQADLETLCRYYQPLSPEMLSNPEGLVNRGKPGFILTFDDGLREIAEVAEPILSRKGINAIFFLNNAFIDNKNLFFRYKASILCGLIVKSATEAATARKLAKILDLPDFQKDEVCKKILKITYQQQSKLDETAKVLGYNFNNYLSEVRPYLTTTEIIDLQKKGFYIGAHSVDHPLLGELSGEQIVREVMESVGDVDRRFHPSLKLFAFPFTDAGIQGSVISILINEGIQGLFGTAGLKTEDEIRHYQRIPFEGTGNTASTILKTEYLYYIMKSFFGKNRMYR